MTDATSVTRTYAVGEFLEPRDFGSYDARCTQPHDGYTCSMPTGHLGPQHVAAYGTREVCAVWDRDTSGDPIVEIPTPEVVAERLEIAQRALIESRAEAERLQALALRAERELAEAVERHEEFRATVVRVAMEKAREHNWCRVVQRALEDMGLEVTQRFAMDVTITATRVVRVQVEAEDETAAYQAVDRMSESELADAYEAYNGGDFSYAALSNGAWTWESHDSSTDVTNLDA